MMITFFREIQTEIFQLKQNRWKRKFRLAGNGKVFFICSLSVRVLISVLCAIQLILAFENRVYALDAQLISRVAVLPFVTFILSSC